MSGGHSDARLQHSTEFQVSADNTSNYYQSEKTIEDPDTTTRTYNAEKKQESGTTGRVNSLNGNDKNTRIESVHGKPGWFSNQDLLKQELDARRFDFWAEVGRLYANELLIMIY